MSLMIEKLTSLGVELFHNAINNLSKSETKLKTPQNTESQNPIARVVKEKKDVTRRELTDVEKHELSRRRSMKAAAGLLQVSDTVSNLEKIAKERNRDSSFGFRSTKEISPNDTLIEQIALTVSEILKVYPSPSNMKVAMGFIEMVDLIDELEDMVKDNKGERMGFGSPSSGKESLLQIEALKYADNLRANIPYLLEWLEVPEYMLMTAPSKN